MRDRLDRPDVGRVVRRGRPGACPPGHESVDEHLVRHEERLILLFTPPFDHSSLDPGYVKGYLPGVRENGGQYTHAATWVMQAAALLGQGRLAYQLLQIICPDPACRGTGSRRALPGRALCRGRRRVQPALPTWAGEAGHGTTGSASWFYQVILESILGFQHRGDRLHFQPCIPPEWSHFEITYRFRSATYTITVENPTRAESGVATVWLDNALQPGTSIPLADDSSAHEVRVVVGQS